MHAVYKAFPADNAFIAVKALVVDPRGENVLGTLMPLDMIGCEPRLAWNQTDALN